MDGPLGRLLRGAQPFPPLSTLRSEPTSHGLKEESPDAEEFQQPVRWNTRGGPSDAYSEGPCLHRPLSNGDASTLEGTACSSAATRGDATMEQKVELDVEHDEGSHPMMRGIRGTGAVGVFCCGFLLSGCGGPVPTHETPSWAQLIDDVQRELAAIRPDPGDLVEPTDPIDLVDPYANLTRTSPNAVATDLADLTVRQCILYPYDENRELMDSVQVVPCTEPHYGEVYATGEFNENKWSDEFEFIVNTACSEEFEDYIGIDYGSSELYFDFSYTSEYGWELGLRGWRCYVLEPDYEYTGSLEGTHR